MSETAPYLSGRHFLQIPGPTNVPDRVLRAIAAPTVDHRGGAFGRLSAALLEGIREVFGTSSPVVIYPCSGTGAWEAALVNTLSPGDSVLMFEVGQFATLWCELARRLGLNVRLVEGDWRTGPAESTVERILAEDTGLSIKAVCVVHNETSTGIATNVAQVRQAMDRAGHPALLLVDAISSLGSMDFRQDEWGVDVTIAGSQKGLMLPPGLGFNAIGPKAMAANKTARLPRAYWDWPQMLAQNKSGFYPYTPATNLLYGLRESLAMLREEGLPNVFARHDRHAESTRRAVRTWGLEVVSRDPGQLSSTVTAVLMPGGCSADEFRRVILERFNMALGSGLGKVHDKVFRIGHLGDFNDLMLAGTLCGVEMGLAVADIPHRPGGAAAAMEYLTEMARQAHGAPAAVR
jgi:alanine-glyoxylate transaminase/serine-glyoxylate transaminase/serine-pyruvate transaminase